MQYILSLYNITSCINKDSFVYLMLLTCICIVFNKTCFLIQFSLWMINKITTESTISQHFSHVS